MSAATRMPASARTRRLVVVCALAAALEPAARADDFAAPLPDGVTAVWDLGKRSAKEHQRASASRSTASGAGSLSEQNGTPRPRGAGATSRSRAVGPASPITCRRTPRLCIRTPRGRT